LEKNTLEFLGEEYTRIPWRRIHLNALENLNALEKKTLEYLGEEYSRIPWRRIH